MHEEADPLIDAARRAAEHSYSPYSRFPVGAAVETEIGVFVGTNVENASYGLALCAERCAIVAAVAAGARRIRRLAVSCPSLPADADRSGRMPCGACRQVMAEFADEQTVVLVDGVGTFSMRELFPGAFRLGTA